MHSLRLIDKIKKLRTEGFTLTEIINKTGISKTTVFDHIQNIPKSKYLKEKIRLARLKAQGIVAARRRGKSVKTYLFLKPEKWSSEFVNLISHFLFDGQLSRTSCGYNNRSQILIQAVIQGMEKYLKVEDYKIYTNTYTGVIRVAYHNVEIAGFIKTKIQELLEYIPSAPTTHKISFLRAFFDDEGSINFRNNGRAVRGYQHSQKLLELIKGLLVDLKIESIIDKRYVEISISKRDNLLKFQKLINFTSGLTVNGNRSNSIWKKDLEKRKILQMALDSYL